MIFFSPDVLYVCVKRRIFFLGFFAEFEENKWLLRNVK